MNSRSLRIYGQVLVWLFALAVAAYLAFGLWVAREALAREWPLLAFLAAAAMLTSALAASGASSRVAVRLSLTFVLAALVLLPSPAGLLVTTLAGLAGRGGGVAGLYRRGIRPFASLVASVTVAEYVVAASAVTRRPDAVSGLVWLLLVYLFVQALAVALGRLSAEDPYNNLVSLRAGVRHALSLETINVALAWLLAGLWLRDHQWASMTVVAVLAVVGETTLVQLSAALRALRRSNRALASRITELDTLHAIGREILSSLEPARVFAIIDRECRKIFDVDSCMIALADVESSKLKLVHHQRRGLAPRSVERPIDEGLTNWVAKRKRGLRIDDLRERKLGRPLRRGLLDGGVRSALAVPLIVKGRVTGVLSVRSRARAAYDDHQLSVLMTIAQQAAVAIENARHYQMATVDSLTGFFLRDYFFGRLDEEYKRVARYGGTFSLLMLDLDGFKSINDEHGHLVGDQFLRDVARTIRLQLRAADLACRYGGDEFCLLLPETEMDGAQAIAERIRAAIAGSPVPVAGLTLRTTASIGIAVFPEHDAGSVGGLVHNADEALYRAKRSGRDCVVPFAA